MPAGGTWDPDTAECEAPTPTCAAGFYRKSDGEDCVAVETCCPEGEYLKPGTTDTCVEVLALRPELMTCMNCGPFMGGPQWLCYDGCLDGEQG